MCVKSINIRVDKHIFLTTGSAKTILGILGFLAEEPGSGGSRNPGGRILEEPGARMTRS